MGVLTKPKKRQQDLVVSDPLSEPIEPIEMVKTYDGEYSPVYVDLRWMPENAMLTHIEGAPWAVTYFSQVLTKDSDLSGQQVSGNNVYQQFIQIDAMDLRVTSPLQTNQEQDSKSMTVTGVAMTLPFIIPNEGDMFLAEISPGEKAVFRVTTTSKKSIFSQACYEISYGLDTTDLVKINNLLSKVVKKLYYHSNYLTYGKNPLLVSTQAQSLTAISQSFFVLLEFYLRKFISIEYKTLILPDQTTVIHDPWLTQFVLDSFSTTNNYLLMNIKQANLQGDAYINTPSIWKAISERNLTWMRMGFTKFTLISRLQFEIIPALAGYRYSGLSYLVYPVQAVDNVDITLRGNDKIGSSIWLEHSNVTPSNQFWLLDQAVVAETPIDEDTGLPSEVQDPAEVSTWLDFPGGDRFESSTTWNLFYATNKYQNVIPPVSDKDTYVFTPEFYQARPYTSFEKMVLDYIDRKPIDNAQIADLSKICLQWGNVEQFYYIPILLAMMKNALMGG